MRTLLFSLLVALLAAGCSARLQVDAGNAPAGNTAGVRVQGGSSSFAAAIIAISLLAGAIEYSREPRPMPNPADLFSDDLSRAPELAPDRRIAEQDCTQPIDFSAGNLRCR